MRLVAALLIFAACHKSEPQQEADYRRTFSTYFRQHETELRTCWAELYAQRPSMKWETPTFRFTIAGNGHVRDVSVTGGDPTVAACWQKTIAAWAFSAPPGGRDYPISYRWSLRGGE